LIEAIKANLFEYYEYLGRSPKAELHDSPNLTWLLTGIPHSFLNVVLRTQVTQGNVDVIIEETLAHFKSRNVTEFFWWAEPGTQPTDLGKHLVDHGLTYTDGGPGMAVDLPALNEALAPANLTIKQVRDAGTLKQWVRTATIGFGLPDSSEGACFDLFAGLGFDLPCRSSPGLSARTSPLYSLPGRGWGRRPIVLAVTSLIDPPTPNTVGLLPWKCNIVKLQFVQVEGRCHYPFHPDR